MPLDDLGAMQSVIDQLAARVDLVEASTAGGAEFWVGADPIRVEVLDDDEGTAVSGFVLTGTGTSLVTIGEGYLCHAGTFSQESDGTETVNPISTDSWVYLQYDMSTDTASFGIASVAGGDGFDNMAADDDVSRWILGRVTATGGGDVTAITQYWFGGLVIYETRA